jgi:hypothetical protein
VTATIEETLEREAQAAAASGTFSGWKLAARKWADAADHWCAFALRAPNIRPGAFENAERCWREAAALGDRLADHCARFTEPTLTLQVLPGGRGRRAEGD